MLTVVDLCGLIERTGFILVKISQDWPILATGALLHSLILYLLACDEILFYNLERNLNTKKSRCEFDVCILIDKDS